MKVTKGQKVPHFSLLDQNEEIVSSDSLLGKNYILFFYPKDDSPGCTKEACSIRDNFKSLQKLGYEIYGVSPDKVKKHNSFIAKYEFQYSLLADTEKEMINAFGLWGKKQFMGREIEGVFRTSVIINEKGIVAEVIEKVVTKSHGLQLIEAIESLSSAG